MLKLLLIILVIVVVVGSIVELITELTEKQEAKMSSLAEILDISKHELETFFTKKEIKEFESLISEALRSLTNQQYEKFITDLRITVQTKLNERRQRKESELMCKLKKIAKESE